MIAQIPHCDNSPSYDSCNIDFSIITEDAIMQEERSHNFWWFEIYWFHKIEIIKLNSILHKIEIIKLNSIQNLKLSSYTCNIDFSIITEDAIMQEERSHNFWWFEISSKIVRTWLAEVWSVNEVSTILTAESNQCYDSWHSNKKIQIFLKMAFQSG